jgi:hypothetical protein
MDGGNADHAGAVICRTAGECETDRRTAGPTETVLPAKDLLRTMDLLRTKGDLVSR